MQCIQSDCCERTLVNSIKLERDDVQQLPQDIESERTMITKTGTARPTTIARKGSVVTLTKMLLYATFLLLIMNPVLVLTQNIDTRAADVKKEPSSTLKPPAILRPNSKSKNDQHPDHDQDITIQKNTHDTISSLKDSGHVNCSLPKNVNSSFCKNDNHGMVSYILGKMSSNSGMLFRTMYVLLAVTGVVIIYFVIKAFRLRRRRSKSRKYGIITKQGDHGDMEMEPLGDGADEDDDYTVFEMGRRK